MTTTPAATQALQQRRTRKPTGRPSWPILLIAGAEKAGKSYACAQASGSDLIGATYWIGIGEDDPDEYGNVPSADFEIVEHDGTYRDILAAIDWAVAQPPVDGKPNLIVVDSMTRLWDLLCDMAQGVAQARARRKAANSRGPAQTDDEVQITMDVWNMTKDRWGHVVESLRDHQGPSLLTARLEEVTVMENGKPTTQKALKVKTEKGLPYDVGGIVQLPERGRAYLTGVRTTRMNVPERVPLPGFTVDKLWRDLGLADVETCPRTHSGIDRGDAPDPNGTVRQIRPALDAQQVAKDAATVNDPDRLRAMWQDAKTSGLIDVDVHGAVTAGQAAVVGLDHREPFPLGAWIAACGKWVSENGGMTVDDAVDPVTVDSKSDPDTI